MHSIFLNSVQEAHWLLGWFQGKVRDDIIIDIRCWRRLFIWLLIAMSISLRRILNGFYHPTILFYLSIH